MRTKSNTTPNHSRIDYIDYAKATCIFLMVVAHSTCYPTVYRYIYSFHMPAFFIISGVLFRPRAWYHTILAFVIPICLISPINWAIQYFIMGMDMSNTTWKEIVSGVLHYRFDTRYNFFPGDWFIWTLVTLRLVFGDIKHLYFMRNKKVYIPIAVLAVIYMVLEPYIIDSQADFLNYTVERAIPCLPFFCIGLYLRDINFQPKDYPVWTIITLGIAALVLPAITGTCDIFYNTYGRSYLLFLINAPITTSLLFYFANRLPPSAIVRTYSVGTLIIIGLNQPLINVFTILLPKQFWLAIPILVMATCYFPIIICEKRFPILLGKWKQGRI